MWRIVAAGPGEGCGSACALILSASLRFKFLAKKRSALVCSLNATCSLLSSPFLDLCSLLWLLLSPFLLCVPFDAL